jgi:prolipoprotein diacylglyceryltransferase
MTDAESFQAILRSGSRELYQLAIVLATITGGALIRYDSRSWPMSRRHKIIVLASAGIGAMVGCALPAYFAGGYIQSVTEQVWIAPKTLLGGLIMAFFATAVAKNLFRIGYDTSDAFVRGGCVMMAIGRLGCIAQHCCFGRVTTSGLGHDFGDGVLRLPTQAIEAAGLFLLLIIMHVCHVRNWIEHRRLFLMFTLYGLMRFGLESLRESVAAPWLTLGFYQWLSLLLIGTGAYQLVVRTRRPHATFINSDQHAGAHL